jgi:hypothetical protein
VRTIADAMPSRHWWNALKWSLSSIPDKENEQGRRAPWYPHGRSSKDSEIKDGHPEFTLASLKKLGRTRTLPTRNPASMTIL